jgi:hypothetical protein
MGIKSRRKGQRGELEFLALLADELGTETLKRNLEQTREGAADCLSIEGYAIEIKRIKDQPKIGLWWGQASRQAAQAGCAPALAWRQDRGPWHVLVALSVEDFATMIRENMK